MEHRSPTGARHNKPGGAALAARNPSITFAPTEASRVSGCPPPELRGFALLVLVCALAFPSVAQVTYNFSAPSPGVSWSFTVPALLTAETTITDFGSSTGNGPNCTIPYVTISDPLGTPSVTTGLGSTCTFTGSWNKLRHKGYLKVPLFPSFNATGQLHRSDADCDTHDNQPDCDTRDNRHLLRRILCEQRRSSVWHA